MFIYLTHQSKLFGQLPFGFIKRRDVFLQQIGSRLAILHIILNYFGEIAWDFHLLSFYLFNLAARDIVMIFESEVSFMENADADFYIVFSFLSISYLNGLKIDPNTR